MRTTRRYLGCCTSRCTSTTIVFCIFALVTLPVRMVRSPRSATGALCVSVVITPSLLSALAREPVFSPAPDPFSLHEAASALPLVPSKAGSAAGKSSPSGPSAGPAIRPRPLRESCQYAAASLKPSCAGYEFRGNGQLVRRQSQSFHGLQSILAERQISAAPGLAIAAAAHLFPVLHLFRHQHRCVLASLISLIACRLRHRCGFAFLLNLRSLLGHVFALVDPALHANHAVRGVSFRRAEINVRTQCLQRQPPLQVPFFARDFRAVQPTGHAHLDALAPEAQSRIH